MIFYDLTVNTHAGNHDSSTCFLPVSHVHNKFFHGHDMVGYSNSEDWKSIFRADGTKWVYEKPLAESSCFHEYAYLQPPRLFWETNNNVVALQEIILCCSTWISASIYWNLLQINKGIPRQIEIRIYSTFVSSM